jgi:hypothetical protein
LRSADYALPGSIGSFELRETTDYPQRELGFSARYVSREHLGLWADFYVYPVDPVPQGLSLGQLLGVHWESVKQEVSAVFSQHGDPPRLASEREYPIEGARRPLSGIWATFDLRRDGREGRSLLFLAIRDRALLKLRASYMGSERPEWEQAIGDLLRGFADAFEARTRHPPPELGIEIGLPVGTSPDSCTGLLVWQLAYAQELREAIARGEFLDGYAREHRLRSRALSVWAEFRDREPAREDAEACRGATQSLTAQRAVLSADYFEEYVWEHYRAPWWLAPDGIDLAAYQSWSLTALPEHDPMRDPNVRVRFEDTPPEP